MTFTTDINVVKPRSLGAWVDASLGGHVRGGPLYEGAKRQYDAYVARNNSSSTSGSVDNLYAKAEQELEGAKGLYQPGGAYDQAFDASKRRSMAGAQASLVGMGMSNVYNPQASGAAFEGENRGNWEMNRTQGLAGAMTTAANFYAGRGSELYQGGLSQSLTGMQTGASLGAVGMQTSADRDIARGGNMTDLMLKQMELGGGGGGPLPGSPFANLQSMWG